VSTIRGIAWVFAAMMILSLVASIPEQVSAEPITITLGPGEHYDIRYEFKDYTKLEYSTVKYGGPELILLELDESNYEKFLAGQPYDYDGYQSLGTSGSGNTKMIGGPSVFYLVFLNQGHSGSASVIYDAKITSLNTPGLFAWVALIILVAFAVILATLLLWSRHRANVVFQDDKNTAAVGESAQKQKAYDLKGSRAILKNSLPTALICLGLLLVFSDMAIQFLSQPALFSPSFLFDNLWFIQFLMPWISLLGPVLLVTGVVIWIRTNGTDRRGAEEKTPLPIVGGVLLVAGSVFGLLMSYLPLIMVSLNGGHSGFDLLWSGLLPLLAIGSFIGGVLALRRRIWSLAMVAGILGIMVDPIPILLGLLLVALSGKEFRGR